MAEPDGNAQVLAQAWAGLARTGYADDPSSAAQYADRALALPNAAGPVVGQLAAGWVALCAGDRRRVPVRRAVRAEAGRRRDPVGLAETLELAAIAATGGPDVARAPAARRAELVEAATIWADVGNKVALATNALLRARCEAIRWPRRSPTKGCPASAYRKAPGRSPARCTGSPAAASGWAGPKPPPSGISG